jgi:hypothetical protein
VNQINTCRGTHSQTHTPVLATVTVSRNSMPPTSCLLAWVNPSGS